MWRIEFTPKAEKEFRKLSRDVQQQISSYLDHVIVHDDPRLFGKPLMGDLTGFWRYRVGKYRVICKIQHERLVIELISVGKRDTIYR